MQAGKSLKDIGPLLKNPRIYQRGYGQCCSSPYRITRMQSGNGIGNVFAKVYRYFKPLVIRGLKEVGREAVSAGNDIISRMDTEPIEEVVQARGKKAINNLKRKATNALGKIMKGSGGTTSKAIKRNGLEKVTQSSRRSHTQKKKKKHSATTIKKKHQDIFD